MNVVVIEIKRALFSFRFILVIGVILAMFTRTMLDWSVFQVVGQMDVLSMSTYPMALSGFTPFAVIFPVLIYSTMFCEEYNSGFIKSIILRIGGKKYMLSRIFATAISGAATIGISFSLLSVCLLVIGVPTTRENVQAFTNTIWWPYVQIGGGALVLLGKIVLGAMFGAVWGLVALYVSTIFANRYVTLIAPFVLYQALWVIFQRIPYLNPLLLLRGDYPATGFVGSFLFILIFQGVWILALGYLSYRGMEKKMEAY